MSAHERLRREILRVHLERHVPACIDYYRHRGDPDEEDYMRCSGYGQDLSQRGELLYYPDEAGASGRRQYRELLEKLVDMTSVLSFSPGGVTLFGAHFDATREDHYEESVQALAEKFSRLLG